MIKLKILYYKVQNDGEIWQLYAYLEAAITIPNKESVDKVLHHLQCAHRFTTQGKKWAQEENSCLTVIDLSLKLSTGTYFNLYVP